MERRGSLSYLPPPPPTQSRFYPRSFIPRSLPLPFFLGFSRKRNVESAAPSAKLCTAFCVDSLRMEHCLESLLFLHHPSSYSHVSSSHSPSSSSHQHPLLIVSVCLSLLCLGPLHSASSLAVSDQLMNVRKRESDLLSSALSYSFSSLPPLPAVNSSHRWSLRPFDGAELRQSANWMGV